MKVILHKKAGSFITKPPVTVIII
jgi:hypothetical protein